MPFLAILELDGTALNVLKLEYKIIQNVDQQGKPDAKPMGGFIHLTVESSNKNGLAEWAISPTMKKTGSITFLKRDANSALKTLGFQDAFCVGYLEKFNASDENPMTIDLTISAGKIKLNATSITRPWSSVMGVASVGAFNVSDVIGGAAENTPPPMTETNTALPKNAEVKSAEQTKAENLIKKASIEEPAVTKLVGELATENGGKMEGLDFKLKTVESLTRKLHTDGIDTDIKDSLRYTMILDNKEISNGAQNVMAKLEAAGYKNIKVKNTFYEGAAYKGINTAFETPDGQPFELQFHTPESFNVKQNLTHGLYEKLRVLKIGDPKAITIQNQIKKLSDAIKLPDKIAEIKDK